MAIFVSKCKFHDLQYFELESFSLTFFELMMSLNLTSRRKSMLNSYLFLEYESLTDFVHNFLYCNLNYFYNCQKHVHNYLKDVFSKRIL